MDLCQIFHFMQAFMALVWATWSHSSVPVVPVCKMGVTGLLSHKVIVWIHEMIVTHNAHFQIAAHILNDNYNRHKAQGFHHRSAGSSSAR